MKQPRPFGQPVDRHRQQFGLRAGLRPRLARESRESGVPGRPAGPLFCERIVTCPDRGVAETPLRDRETPHRAQDPHDSRCEDRSRCGPRRTVWGRDERAEPGGSTEPRALSRRFLLPVVGDRVRSFEITDCDLKKGQRWAPLSTVGFHRAWRHHGGVGPQEPARHRAGYGPLPLFFYRT